MKSQENPFASETAIGGETAPKSAKARSGSALLASKGIRMEDIAAEAGVSRRAVSRVLFPNGSRGIRVSEKTALKVKEIAQRLGYLPNFSARQLAGEKSRLVGVLIDSFGSEVFYNMLQQLERGMAAHGYRLLIGQVHNDLHSIEEYLRDFTSRGVEGVISFAHNYPKYREEILELYRPVANVISIGDPVIPGADSVCVDTAEGVRMLMRHLHGTGRRRIALLLSEGSHSTARMKGFQAGVEALSLELSSCPVCLFNRREGEKPTREAIHEGLARLLKENDGVDAIIAANDLVALYTIQFLGLQGIAVPEQIAVAGFDNLEFGWAASPPITSIDQRPALVAEKVIELLVARAANPALEPQSVAVSPQLMIRESTSPVSVGGKTRHRTL